MIGMMVMLKVVRPWPCLQIKTVQEWKQGYSRGTIRLL